jgi:predicted DNA-binding transcriptional regulator YafY
MRKSDRLFQLTNILRRHQPITAAMLAKKLMVSERTIYRYVDDLSLAGIPVYGEAGVGYRLSEGFELPPLQLSPAELEALIASISFTAALTGAHFSAAARSVLGKIEAALPKQSTPLTDTEQVVRVPMKRTSSTDYALWGTIHTSIANQSWIDIDYQSLASEVTTRTVYPLGLFYWGGKWTLGCWCALRQDYRDFRIDHILRLNENTRVNVLPQQVSLLAYIKLKNNQTD